MQRVSRKLKISGYILLSNLALIFVLTGSSQVVTAEDLTSNQASDISVEVVGGCTLSTTNNEHNETLSAGTYTSNIGDDSIVSISCNDGNGYNVYAVGFSGDKEGNTDMIGLSPNNKITTGTATSGNISNWSFKLSSPIGTTLTSAYTNYNKIPSLSTMVAYRLPETATSYNDSFHATYAAFISATQARDTYIGKVKYTLFHNEHYIYENGDDCVRSGYSGPAKYYGGYCWMWEDYKTDVNWETAQYSCPAGWHIPTKDQFQSLLDAIGTDDRLLNEGWYGSYWSSTEHHSNSAYLLNVNNGRASIIYFNSVTDGYDPMRCVSP